MTINLPRTERAARHAWLVEGFDLIAILVIIALASCAGFANAFLLQTSSAMQQTVAYLGMGFSATCFTLSMVGIGIIIAIEKIERPPAR